MKWCHLIESYGAKNNNRSKIKFIVIVAKKEGAAPKP
jgi:hypothetical protein